MTMTTREMPADSPIRASTVGTLRLAWSIATPGALTTAVVVVGNTVYAEDDRGVVVAVDKSTGQTLWQSASTGFTVGPEGVALGGGKVFAATTDGLEALDARSGRVLWTTRLTQTTTAGVDMQPTVIGSRVLIATVPVSVAVQYEGGDSGDLFAVDAATGKVDWSFDTVASKDLWGNPSVNSGGGAWYPPAIDTKTGIVYLGNCQSRSVPRHHSVSERVEPSGSKPLYRLDRGPQPHHGSADLVPPSCRPRSFRPRLCPCHLGHGEHWHRAPSDRCGHGQGWPGPGNESGDRSTSLGDLRRCSAEPFADISDRASRQSCPAHLEVSLPHRPRPTATSMSPP